MGKTVSEHHKFGCGGRRGGMMAHEGDDPPWRWFQVGSRVLDPVDNWCLKSADMCC